MSNRGVTKWSLLPIIALLCGGTAAAQGSRGTISGQVTDSSAQRPLGGVEVFVVVNGTPTTKGARTAEGGRYTISDVPAGSVTLRARFVGYAAKDQVVAVSDGQTATANFSLVQRLTVLDQVVVTGTGGAVERRSVGNVIESINANEVIQQSGARSVEQLIGARTPGVIVLPPTGQVGTGAQLRVRAVSSLSLSTDPIIYIDGVRMDGDVSRGPTQRGGAGASRLNDLPPEDIESIEIIKGPAASTLYGTEASNGVVQIITKRGRSGAAKWNFSTRQGTNWLQNPEGRAGLLWYIDPTTQQPASFNLYKYQIDQGKGPVFTDGLNEGYQMAVSGGTDANRYYLSTGYDHDVGVVDWNWDRKFTLRANLDLQPMNKLRIQANVGHIRDRLRLAQPGGINPDPFSNLVWGRFSLIPRTGGFGFAPRELWGTVQNRADADRTTSSITTMYEPWSWFTHRLVAGLDYDSENNYELWPRQLPANQTFYGTQGLGFKNAARVSRSFLTLDYAANAKYSYKFLDFTSTFGLQHYRTESSSISATGNTFAATPLTTIGNGATTTGNEAYVANATVGLFVQQQLAWRNRVFLTGAIRGDDNSSFGKDYQAAYYPKLSASWVISEEPWFSLPVVSSLRLRSAFGAAGTQPGTFDALRLYSSIVGAGNAPGIVPNSPGNPALKPETSKEFELGFETSVLNNRADFSYTYYGRNITDQIVSVPLPPSQGGWLASQTLNIGRSKAWGQEFAANVRAFQGRRVSWQLGSQISTSGNRILTLNGPVPGTKFFTVGGGGQAQNRLGWSIADIFMIKVRSAPANGSVTGAICDGGTGKDGLEQGGADVPCATAPRLFWGHTQPTWQLGFNSTVTLWNNVSLYARVDGNGGNVQSNTEIRALHNQGSSQGVVMKDPILAVYRSLEADAPGTYKAGFMKLRELSATYNVPGRFVSRLGASGATVSVAGRNLSTLWTAQHGWKTSRDGEIYTGIADGHSWDPEIRAVGSLSNGFQTIMPPTSSFVTTFRLNF
jgi:TonB-linked SusC/RagA family outer membrane protein